MNTLPQATVITPVIARKLKLIKLFATDFDGVHTDGTVTVDEHGTESVRCSRKDGLAYDMLAAAGIRACVISKEANPVVLQRCKKLKIPCYQQVGTSEGKRDILKRVAEEFNLVPEQVLYMGDDLNDLDALKFAGVSVAVRDAHESVIKTANIIIGRVGGDHAIREMCEILLAAQTRSLTW
jgi:N-acylneuraminate cytidylyltransferase